MRKKRIFGSDLTVTGYPMYFCFATKRAEFLCITGRGKIKYPSQVLQLAHSSTKIAGDVNQGRTGLCLWEQFM